jgi:hypothetical protein
MAIVGSTFTKLFAQRKNIPKGNIKINHGLEIRDIKKQDINIEKGKGIIEFLFEFKADYTPNVGEIDILGKIHYMDEEKRVKEIISNWDRDKKTDPKIMTPIINNAFHKSLLKGLELSESVGLPPVIPMPKVTPKSTKGKDYIG